MVRPVGIEPTHLAPEASALSTELRAHFNKISTQIINHRLLKVKVFALRTRKENILNAGNKK